MENSGSSNDSSEDAHEHNFSNWSTIKEPTETEEGEKHRTCLVCGETDVVTVLPNGEEHRFTEWEIIKQPTETEKGFKSRTCTDEGCGYHEAKIIPKLGNDSLGSATDGLAAGCESAIVTSSSLISIAVFIGCAVVCKKGKKEE